MEKFKDLIEALPPSIKTQMNDMGKSNKFKILISRIYPLSKKCECVFELLEQWTFRYKREVVNEVCLCSHKGLMWKNKIYNIHTGNNEEVGNECIKNFFPEIIKFMKEMKTKFRKDLKKFKELQKFKDFRQCKDCGKYVIKLTEKNWKIRCLPCYKKWKNTGFHYT